MGRGYGRIGEDERLLLQSCLRHDSSLEEGAQAVNKNRGDELLQSCLWHDSSLEEGARLSTIIEQKANSAQNAGAPTDTTQLIA